MTEHSERAFLNKKGHGGLAAVEVSYERFGDNEQWLDLYLAITDCSRQISLDFSITHEGSDAKARAACKRQLHKAKLLEKYIQKVISILEEYDA